MYFGPNLVMADNIYICLGRAISAGHKIANLSEHELLIDRPVDSYRPLHIPSISPLKVL